MYPVKIFIISVLVLTSFPIDANACTCKEKPKPDIRDFNDSELIFTATLAEYKIGMSAGVLVFHPKQIFKGDGLPAHLPMYFSPQNTHLLFNKDVKFKEQQDWIVFARKISVGSREYIRFIEAESIQYCALTRPLKEDQDGDPYLAFLRETGEFPDGYHCIFDAKDILVAEGNYKDNYPVAEWQYYQSDGDPDITGNYEAGKREGEWQKYTRILKGEPMVIQKRFYHQGTLTEIHDLNYSGNISFKKMLTDSTEIRHYFDENSVLISITHRNKDYNSMKTTTFFHNGGIKEQKFFQRSKLIQKTEFDENGQKVNEWIRDPEKHN